MRPFRGPSSTRVPLDACDQIYELFCRELGETKDPSGYVLPDIEGEQLARDLYDEISRDHSNWTTAEKNEEFVKQIFTPKRRARIELAYTWVVKIMGDLFDRQEDFSSKEKAIIRSRIRKAQLQLPPPASIYSDTPHLLKKTDVSYERTPGGQLRLRVGGAYVLTAGSWFNLVYTMAHELAHAVDPCEIRMARQSFPAYDHLTACFLDTRLIATRSTRAECGRNDQLSEVFADWVAVQVVAEALGGYATEFDSQQILSAAQNSIRDLCDQSNPDDEFDLELHPSPAIRIEIFRKNPRIRELLGCRPLEAEQPYCTFNWTKPLTPHPAPPTTPGSAPSQNP